MRSSFFIRGVPTMPWPGSAELLAPLAPWFNAVRRELPWRAQDLDSLHPDPYAVLVSELMLQQTQVATVIPYFHRWMARYPNAQTLALATQDDIHKLWEGLGYYRRARLLQGAAQIISQGGWPTDLSGLLELPGLGPYTAAAVASIAFQHPEPALDGNAFRVLARVLGIEGDPKQEAIRLREWLKPALVRHGPARMTQALMELGALVCGPLPKCADCPLRGACLAHSWGAIDRIPPRVTRPKPPTIDLWLVAIRAKGHWLLRPPAQKGLLAGLWSWPTVAHEPTDDLAAEGTLPFDLRAWRTWPGWTQVYTHRRERVLPVALELETQFRHPHLTWVEEKSLNGLPMGKRDQRLRELIGTTPPINNEAPPLAGLLASLGLGG